MMWEIKFTGYLYRALVIFVTVTVDRGRVCPGVINLLTTGPSHYTNFTGLQVPTETSTPVFIHPSQ